MNNILTVSPAPHFKDKPTVKSLMFTVCLALLPAFGCSLWFFGLGALITTLVSVCSCVIFEWTITKFFLKKQPSISDGSAILTGILLAFNLPCNISPLIVVFGAFISIAIVKMCFGGLGANNFNPALVGRVFLLISFPVQMTSWPKPIECRMQYLDAVTGATPLSYMKAGEKAGMQVSSYIDKMPDVSNLLYGQTGGSLGEVAALALLIGGIFLIWKKVITWHIPVSIIATVFVFTAILWLTDSSIHINPVYHLMTGGLILGSFFMATDYVTSPMCGDGKIVYGIGIGLITVIIRVWGSFPEGISFAILIMNALVPLINKGFKPQRFGSK